jgi:hypothetical protein
VSLLLEAATFGFLRNSFLIEAAAASVVIVVFFDEFEFSLDFRVVGGNS